MGNTMKEEGSSSSTSLVGGSSVYISDEGVSNLSHYKPSSQLDYSFISKILNPYWNYVATLFPDWMAPNTITLIGFLAVVFTFLATIYTNDSAEHRWIYLMNAIALFWYQTMDACDGKHARRTQTSSPLGELFDHGCDSINSLMQTVLALAAMQLLNVDDAWICFVTLLTVTAMFYISIWQQYHTAVLNFQNFSGPTEGQFVVMIVNLVVFAFGPIVFNDNLIHLILGNVDESSMLYSLSKSEFVKLKYIIIFGVNVSTITGVFQCLRDTIQSINNTHDLENSNGQEKRMNKTPVFKSLCSYLVFALVFTVWILISGSKQTLERNLLSVLYSYGMFHAYIVTRTILARVCDMTIPTLMPVLYFLIVGLLNTLFGIMKGGNAILDEGLYLNILVIVTTIMYTHLAYDVISTLTAHLGIYCFSVQKRNPINPTSK
ncbi:predicted protein [Naegleria gruberi]|uniref:Predicted protein n=1 Tax=Naegleria gruberi TaxID=5762 RepID=D2VEZ9_NAEGR|nr:uncharacterized protein NAEGRDRAFT_48997 [Naegleria gruberi]EFC44595.1 predicted protein [Naegleria gruberi]|eukprot:XP_002677339.1 predicted protein [Naegleria gruberi strain NEG-M]